MLKRVEKLIPNRLPVRDLRFRFDRRPNLCFLVALVGCLFMPPLCLAVTVEEALIYVPVQNDVDYDRPSAKDLAQCTVKSEQIGAASAWVVRGPGGAILRAFTDTNHDNKVDQWRYYANGIESYRDMDTNFNGKADQHRWMGLSGLKWGLDREEDGQIDDWKMISPEEISAEIVAAIRDKDVRRFASVLATEEDLKSLGLSEAGEKRLAERLGTAVRRFQLAVKDQNLVDAQSEWVHFSATRPGVLAAESNGNSKDIFVYDNVAAMLNEGQVAIGTLIKFGDQWKAIDVPAGLMKNEGRVETTSFLLSSADIAPEPPAGGEDLLSDEMRELVAQVESVDKTLSNASGKEKAALYNKQATLLRELANKSKTQQNQLIWIRQLAETLATGAQSGDFPDGVDKLEKLLDELAKQDPKADLTGFVRYRMISSSYALRLKKGENLGNVQDWWLGELESYVEDFPEGSDAVEAMLEAAIAEEIAGNEKPAMKWYDKIIAKGGDGLEAKKAAGAKRRLTSVGELLEFGGDQVTGKPINTAQLRGRFVLIHYWATWCQPCREDMKTIEKLVDKYGKTFLPIGVNLDSDEKQVAAFLKQNKLRWPQIYEKGGLDSRPAVELGILSVPTMILLDEKGEVVNRMIHMDELEDYLAKELD